MRFKSQSFPRLRIMLASLSIIVIISSCVSQRDVTYFQPIDPAHDIETSDLVQSYEPKLRSGDIISVMVSSLSPEASTMFNPHLIEQNRTVQNTQTNNIPPVNGYLVDRDGMIKLPLIGMVKVAGLTTLETSNIVTAELENYLKEPTVNIRILNFRVSVLGEVVRPSVYTVPNEKIAITEAISLAGDMTIYGKRNNVMLIREVDGKRQFVRIDMTKRDIFSSPYYYLHPDDVIYVEPTKGKVTSSDRTIQLAPIIISGLSLLALIITNITR